jgi:hypothetical protein
MASISFLSSNYNTQVVAFPPQPSEADLELPLGNHYLLYEVLRRILGVHTTKETMKDVARKALDNGFDPD